MITHCITLLWYKKWPIQCAKHNVPHEETVQHMIIATAEKIWVCGHQVHLTQTSFSHSLSLALGEGILSANPTDGDTLALCSWPAVVNCLQFWAGCCRVLIVLISAPPRQNRHAISKIFHLLSEISCFQKHHFHQILCDVFRLQAGTSGHEQAYVFNPCMQV